MDSQSTEYIPATAIEADEIAPEEVEALDDETLASSTASLSESILEYRRLNGRTYQSTKTTDYWAPNDKQQNEGLDLIHHALLKLFNDELVLAPIADTPERILDIGTGTGIWATDVGEQYPKTEVIGTDISPIQPSWVSPNVKFIIEDFLSPWTWPENHFDLIHLRSLYGVIPDLAELYATSLRHTKPGGWVQHLEMETLIESDHVRFPPGHVFQKVADLTYAAGDRIGRSFRLAQGHILRDAMTAAGFVDVVEVKRKAPMHSWPRDPRLRDVGTFLQTAFDESLEGLVMFMLTQIMALEQAEAQQLVVDMRRESRKRSNYSWFQVTVVYGRKPEA
ncbi:S-adenosyl-L-methionine-dependent methyltransferase [Plectosphaerella plurivora]|uniref:S-adenosyl-L-methionine-dependent methyltransferase n=1 Tax=Plectosphaerella plurivora TaxID=936078 RepID=A0A9P8V7K6_9PEZI|nr:S-adenosyl-L-methionine-dependent methyltransferase [Plectosphaerella plurivora]